MMYICEHCTIGGLFSFIYYIGSTCTKCYSTYLCFEIGNENVIVFRYSLVIVQCSKSAPNVQIHMYILYSMVEGKTKPNFSIKMVDSTRNKKVITKVLTKKDV